MYTMYYDPFCPFHKKKKKKKVVPLIFTFYFMTWQKKKKTLKTETQTTGQIPNQEYVNTDY